MCGEVHENGRLETVVENGRTGQRSGGRERDTHGVGVFRDEDTLARGISVNRVRREEKPQLSNESFCFFIFGR